MTTPSRVDQRDGRRRRCLVDVEDEAAHVSFSSRFMPAIASSRQKQRRLCHGKSRQAELDALLQAIGQACAHGRAADVARISRKSMISLDLLAMRDLLVERRPVPPSICQKMFLCIHDPSARP